MPVLTEAINLGDLLKYEAPNLYSRDLVTVASGQNLVLGTVLGVVTATGKAKALDPEATDGTEEAAGVLLVAIDASLSDRVGGVNLDRHAVVADHALTWPSDITAPQKAAAIAQLKALGVLVRHAV